MGFDDVTRDFKPKSTFVRLECLNCGKSLDDVRSRQPFWYNWVQADTAVQCVRGRTTTDLAYIGTAKNSCFEAA